MTTNNIVGILAHALAFRSTDPSDFSYHVCAFKEDRSSEFEIDISPNGHDVEYWDDVETRFNYFYNLVRPIYSKLRHNFGFSSQVAYQLTVSLLSGDDDWTFRTTNSKKSPVCVFTL